MKYASKVIELMASYPGRDFRMIEIVRYVCPAPESTEARHAVRIAVSRVLLSLSDCGTILIRPPRVARGGYALYRWRVERSGEC